MATLYEELGVSSDATPDQIKAARNRLLKDEKLHPDLRGGKPITEKENERFLRINEAVDILSNPDKKRRYDETGRTDARKGHYQDENGVNFETTDRPHSEKQSAGGNPRSEAKPPKSSRNPDGSQSRSNSRFYETYQQRTRAENFPKYTERKTKYSPSEFSDRWYDFNNLEWKNIRKEHNTETDTVSISEAQLGLIAAMETAILSEADGAWTVKNKDENEEVKTLFSINKSEGATTLFIDNDNNPFGITSEGQRKISYLTMYAGENDGNSKISMSPELSTILTASLLMMAQEKAKCTRDGKPFIPSESDRLLLNFFGKINGGNEGRRINLSELSHEIDMARSEMVFTETGLPIRTPEGNSQRVILNLGENRV